MTPLACDAKANSRLVSALPVVALPFNEQVQVAWVEDGDTVVVRDLTYGLFRVRLHAIDAPERLQAAGHEAKRALQGLLKNKNVEAACYKVDMHGRAVCRLRLAGIDPELELVRAGWAWHLQFFKREQTRAEWRLLANAQQQAKKYRRGLWRSPNPMPPWQCRQQLQTTKSCD